MELIRASEVQVGDVILGPDGTSTVVGIRTEQGLLKFNFVEGVGNHCWSGLLPEERISRYRKSTDTPTAERKVEALLRIIERIIARHHRGVIVLDEPSFELFELAKRIYDADSEKALMYVLADLARFYK